MIDHEEIANSKLTLEQKLKQVSTTRLLKDDAKLFCLNNLKKEEYTESEQLCINNYQKKTLRAFDIFFAYYQINERTKTPRDLVDISAYTGMEIEHGHDTAD